jgi:hypothetical protein
MRAFAGFLIRLVAYAVLLGVVSRGAESLWVAHGLDGSIELQQFHDNGTLTLVIAPLVLALIGFGPLHRAAVFVAALLAGAALTAPFAFAHFVNGA